MSLWCLGIHIGHDRGACLVNNGKVMVSIPQERLDGKKHSRAFALPYQAIDAVMKYCDLTPKDIDSVGFSADAVEVENIVCFFQKEFQFHYGCRLPFYPVDHHTAHAETAFAMSSSKKCLVLVADGGGDIFGEKAQAESLYLGANGELTLLEQRLQDPPKRKMSNMANHICPFIPTGMRSQEISIGRKYEQITYLLQFGFGEAG